MTNDILSFPLPSDDDPKNAPPPVTSPTADALPGRVERAVAEFLAAEKQVARSEGRVKDEEDWLAIRQAGLSHSRRALIRKGWRLGFRLQAITRGQRGPKGAVSQPGKLGKNFLAKLKEKGIPKSNAYRLMDLAHIPKSELDRRLHAGERRITFLYEVGRVEFDKARKPTGKSVDGRGTTDDRFPYIVNVKDRFGDEIDALHKIADALPDTALRSRLWHVLCRIQLGIVEINEQEEKGEVVDVDVDPRPAFALACAIEPSYGRLVDGVRVLGGIADDSIRAERAKDDAKPEPKS